MRLSASFRRLALPLSTLALAFVLACKPSTEGETKKYERNKIELAELTTTWPGFKTIGDAQLATAEEAWKSASDVAGEEERAKAMEAANEAFDPLLNKLSQVKSKSERLEERIRKLRNIRLNTKKNKARREQVIEDASAVLAQVDAAMTGASPADAGTADAFLQDQIGKLISAAGPIDRMIEKFKTKVKVGGKKKGKK